MHLFVNLEKEISSRENDLHFRRWSLFQTPWFKVYLHKTYKSDTEPYAHDHPWDFTTIILRGGYLEKNYVDYNLDLKPRFCIPGDVIRHKAEDAHLIELIRPTLSLVIVGKYRRPDWGFQTEFGFMTKKDYFARKNEMRNKHGEAKT